MNDQEPESKSFLITSVNAEDHSSGHVNHHHEFRKIFAQVLVTVAQSLLLLDLGMMIAVPTIVNGVLHGAKEGLSLDDNQSSWFVSILFLSQPFGSLLSGCTQGAIGRKKGMLLVNVPHLAAWYLLYSAESVATLYVASLIMGFGMGFLEAPILAYIGEVSEPRLRGMLAMCANSNIMTGHLLEYLFGYVFSSWRHVMLVSCSVPVVAVLAVSQIPESPIWLLTKGKKSEAMSALKWLRGWVSDDEVIDEFHNLESYCEASKIDYRSKWQTSIEKESAGYTGVPGSENVVPAGKPGFVDTVKDLLRPEILKPLRLVVVYFFFYHAASLTAMRPYMIQVFTELEILSSPNLITVISALSQCAGMLACMCLLRPAGKRTLSLASMAGCSACCLSLGAYAYAARWYEAPPSLPLSLFCVLYFSISLGIGPVPWLLISEVFPTRGRGVAGGVCAAIFYILAFLVSKTWLDLNDLVGLHGCFLMNGLLGVLGIVYVFFCVPETEGKTLEEIEKYFSKKTNVPPSRPIVDDL